MMKKWTFIDIDDSIGGGMTEEGYDVTEMTISGWNDDENFSDLEELVSVEATEKEDNIEFSIKYHYEFLHVDPTIEKLVEEIKSDLLKWIS